MKDPRLHVTLLLFGFLGPLSFARAQEVCYHQNVPAGVDYQLLPGETCRSANPPIGDPGNLYDPYVTVPNDYAILYFDAKKDNCAAGARDKLEAKLRANLNYANSGGKICDPRRDSQGALPTTNPFRSHLSGGLMTGIFSTALTLLDKGYTVDDALLQGVRNHHASVPSPQDPRCGVSSLPNVNSCMDDYSVTAAGFGWIAAYEHRRGRTTDPITGLTWANRAKGEINKALSHWNQSGSICYYPKGSNPGRCDATRADVEANPRRANVIGADHNQENPAYGLGLMTSIATACEGLKRANTTVPGSACSFTSDQIWTAQQLFIHAQQRTYFDTSSWKYRFTPWCRHFPDGNSIGCWDPLFGPDHLPGYLPTLFPIKRFYDFMGLTPSPLSTVVHNGWGDHPAYQFHLYDEQGRFSWDRGNFWGPVRKLFYEELASVTWPAHSPQAFTYWIQPAALAGFGAPGSLTVAGGSTQSGPSYPVRMYWRNVTTNSAWTLAPVQPTPDPNGNPKDVWYNSVPAPTNPYDWYEVAVQHLGGPFHYCTYKGGNTIWWCKTNDITAVWP
ncbi:MAG TPA: hypothetical protein VE685_04955 [Thermoanaerobaculia bacterium]|nr:hypothetical protein [Thermoanaerobaculia bacterium]